MKSNLRIILENIIESLEDITENMDKIGDLLIRILLINLLIVSILLTFSFGIIIIKNTLNLVTENYNCPQIQQGDK